MRPLEGTEPTPKLRENVGCKIYRIQKFIAYMAKEGGRLQTLEFLDDTERIRRQVNLHALYVKKQCFAFSLLTDCLFVCPKVVEKPEGVGHQRNHSKPLSKKCCTIFGLRGCHASSDLPPLKEGLAFYTEGSAHDATSHEAPRDHAPDGGETHQGWTAHPQGHLGKVQGRGKEGHSAGSW